MKLSVVIPVFNEEKFIGQCLKSLFSQEEKPDEIIVVDNNCNDNSINIAKKFKIKIIKEKKQGIVYARNKGFNNAVGEIIARCDADSIAPSYWVKKIKKNFEKKEIDGLTGPIIYYDLPLRTPLYSHLYFKLMTKLQKGKKTLLGINMAISKKIWEKVKNKVCLNEKKIHEDIDLALHIQKEGGTISIDNSLIVETSARRIKKYPFSFFIEYPIKLFNTLKNH